MNLVQINEHLKNLPMQVIQQYANGMNPEVPPYLALGELKRRELSQKQMATAQGGMQGPQPSVKEQVEQKASLMMTQGLQQQAAQQAQQPRGPMPAPAGTPQPEVQPQEAMMARGGLAGIPVRQGMFDYADGGIVAFQVGGKAPRVQDEVPITEEERDRLQRELLMRIIGEEARNPPERKTPIEMTEADMTSIPGMERSDLMAREMRKAAGPQRDNRAMINRSESKGLDDTRRAELVSQIPAGGPTVTGGDRVDSTEAERNIKNTLMSLPGAAASRALSGGPGAIKGIAAALASLTGKEPKEDAAAAPAATPASQAAVSRPTERMTPQQMEASMVSAGLPGAAQKRGVDVGAVSTAQKPSEAPGAQRLPAPAAAGATSPQVDLPSKVPGRSPYFAQMDADLAKTIAKPTPQEIIAAQRALSPEAMQEDFMKKRMQEQRDRASGERAAFEKTRPSGLDDLIRVFGQAGQYKGLSGTGPAYTANLQQKRAEELAMEKRQNELLNAIDTREYEGAKELFGARSKSMDAANTAYQNQLMTRTKSLADMAGVDQRRMDEAANRLTQVELEKMRIAARAAEASRPGEAERIEAKYMSLKASGKNKEAEEYLENISKIKGGGTAGVGAGRNRIMERRQEMKELEGMAKNEQGQYSDADAKWAAARITQLAKANAQEGGEGGKTGEVDKTNPLLK